MSKYDIQRQKICYWVQISLLHQNQKHLTLIVLSFDHPGQCRDHSLQAQQPAQGRAVIVQHLELLTSCRKILIILWAHIQVLETHVTQVVFHLVEARVRATYTVGDGGKQMEMNSIHEVRLQNMVYFRNFIEYTLTLELFCDTTIEYCC